MFFIILAVNVVILIEMHVNAAKQHRGTQVTRHFGLVDPVESLLLTLVDSS